MMLRNREVGKEKLNWLFLIPFYASTQSVSVYIPLGVIALGGSVIDVSLAVTAYYLLLVPTTLLWGHVCDLGGWRKKLLYLASAISLLSSIALYYSRSIASLIAIFGIYSQTAAIFAPAFNLLILESLPKKQWEKGYTISNIYMFVGQVIGLVAGVAWTASFPITSYPIIPAIFSAAALLFISKMPEPKILLERRSILWSAQGLIHRLTHLPLIFLRRPHLTDFKSIAAMSRKALTREIPLIFAASFLFMLSANLFFTPYTPYLKHVGLSDSEVFLLNIYIVAANAFTSQFLLKRFSGKVSHVVASKALIARAIGMLLAAVFASLITDTRIFYTTMVVYALLGAAYATINVNLNSLLFRALPVGKQGGLLGVFSSLNGIAFLIGAFASGYLSYYFSYTTTFFLAAILVFLASIILEIHYKR
jgi:MFS family permease